MDGGIEEGRDDDGGGGVYEGGVSDGEGGWSTDSVGSVGFVLALWVLG
jgi:hypothetical protein